MILFVAQAIYIFLITSISAGIIKVFSPLMVRGFTLYLKKGGYNVEKLLSRNPKTQWLSSLIPHYVIPSIVLIPAFYVAFTLVDAAQQMSASASITGPLFRCLGEGALTGLIYGMVGCLGTFVFFGYQKVIKNHKTHMLMYR